MQTYVLEHDWRVIADAIRRELARGGQVYYLHNRVETIERCAAQHQDAPLRGRRRRASAHGKMDEDELADVMAEARWTGEIQVLVCTTIIETGIDIPNVNTLDHRGRGSPRPCAAPSDSRARRAAPRAAPMPI